MMDSSPQPYRYSEAQFLTKDHLKLFCRIYDAGPGSDLLLIQHGQGEHSGRYEKFARHLASENYSVVVPDLRGHGRSEGPRSHVNHFEDYLGDLSVIWSSVQGRFHYLQKLTLLGHSLGGLIATHWAIQNPDYLNGLVLSSPCLGLPLGGLLGPLNSFIDRMNPGFVYVNPVYVRNLTHDEEEIKKHQSDPLIIRKITARLVREMINYGSQLTGEKQLNFNFPVVILMAGDDKIVDSKKTQRFFDSIHAPYKEIEVYPGYYHEVFNEVEQQQVFEVFKTHLRNFRKIHSR